MAPPRRRDRRSLDANWLIETQPGRVCVEWLAKQNEAEASAAGARADELLLAHREAIFRRTDRLFAVLLVVQWVAGIIAALVVAPRSWEGVISRTHVHVYAAVYLGGLITVFPVLLAIFAPGRVLTRHCIAVGQILFSSLLIHLTGGLIETHFHIF